MITHIAFANFTQFKFCGSHAEALRYVELFGDGAIFVRDTIDHRTLISWMLLRFDAGDHGCMTGDCDHLKGEDCIDSIISAYCDDCDGEF